jgi:hypothetical protein
LTKVWDYSIKSERRQNRMGEIDISKFKSTCLAALERVRKTRKPVLVTRFGVALVGVVPPTTRPKKKRWIGSMEGTGKIVGDIVSPQLMIRTGKSSTRETPS